MMSKLPDELLNEFVDIFQSYGPLKILAYKTCQQNISKTI